MIDNIIVALLSLAGTLAGAYFANRKASILIAYRLEELEKRVQAHNNLVEKYYRLDDRANVAEEKIKVINHRIDDLEEYHK